MNYSIKGSVFYFKQLPLKTKPKIEFAYQLIDKKTLLSVVVKLFSVNETLDFCDTIFSVSPSLFKV